ncbi:hypothetical protein [Tepidiforma thermophila]|uniref:Uncharacterized protein n=1 Tax=Tepidiforma thermophila (strain KCTC 52669 / CGMCC 1.13589 / G233) TaxID=2761530 RepID=A0A2A9HDT6_TEPT2|nr:hypothetical protein [Tepidiforma thermophila]PFG73493.1 hypothetical protein A9A59_0691 [Tepidiforma thermophila]
MSKELAQTVGGKRVAWLIALLAAFAVAAALGSQWRTSSAALPSTTAVISSTGGTGPGDSRNYTITLTFNPSPSASAGGGSFTIDLDDDLIINGLPASTVPGIPVCSVNPGNVVTCATVANPNGFTNGTITINATNPYSGGTISPPTGCQITEGTTVSCTGTTHSAYTVANAVSVSPESATNALGVPHTFTFTFSGTETCASDTDNDSVTPECTAADVNLSPGLSLVSIQVDGSDVLVTVLNSSPTSPGGTVSLDVATGDDPEDDDYTTFTSAEGTKDYVRPHLYHMADNGLPIVAQEVNNNVRGSQHTICVATAGYDANNDGDYLDSGDGDIAPVGLVLPGLTLSNIVVTNGGGYASTADTDPTFSDVQIYVGSVGGQDATCITWRSLDAGDQTISLLYVGADGQNYNVFWRPNVSNLNTAGTQGVVKEWNRLEDSTVTLSGGATGSGTGNSESTPVISRTLGVTLNPVTGQYQGEPVIISDVFRGSHTNTPGQKEGPMPLAGVQWTVDRAPGSSSCGNLGGALSGTTTLTSTPAGGPNTHVVGGQPNVTFDPDGCAPGQRVVIRIRGTEPGALGSGTGNTVTQLIEFNFVTSIPAKHVFLAWAGQRVVLEHNWALDPSTRASSQATCPVQQGTGLVTYIRQANSPGNFIPGGTVNTISGNDEASATFQANDSSYPCISVAVYESEDQGQVDVEAFIPGEPASKVAWVVYYMKIETVNLSLVTQVSKPTHNGSTAPDWAPGNPWDASQDDSDGTTEWNVSRDILVRGRVSGWFVNSNPSGRPADTSNPLNVRPANRWVMPNDWPLLAGGPDGEEAFGTAEQFRPYYDIMIAPNNALGLALASNSGVGLNLVAVVAAGNSGVGTSTSPIGVTTCASLQTGDIVIFSNSPSVNRTVISCSGTALVINPAFTAAPPAGTAIFEASGTPFIGPYSALDIVGLSKDGFGTTAPTSLSGFTVRDTAWKDFDVDWWDAPMPPAILSVGLRGTGFIKAVFKDEVYYLGTPNTDPVATGGTQVYPNPYYWTEIPESPFISAVAAGGGFLWDSWGTNGSAQGPYLFWRPVRVGVNSAGIGEALSSTDITELGIIRSAYGDQTIARDLVVFSDNHGEFMVAANGDFKTDLSACATNALAGGKHCKPGDKVGTATITATADYPDFRGKHFPVASNAVTVDWTWGGYKDVSIQPGETDQFVYVVFHALDRDGFCSVPSGAVSLHPVLTSADAGNDFSALGARYNGDPNENVDFLIDSGEGIIIAQSGGGAINDGKRFATGVTTFSVKANNPATSGIKEFPLSPLAAEGQDDECQAWIKVSNSLLGIVNVLVIAKDDEGNIGFDRVIDLQTTTSYTLNFRWSLITWAGADNIPVMDAIKGTGKNEAGNDISDSVTAIYGWNAAAQAWLGFFPAGVDVPGANDLTALKTGEAYWIAITGPSSVTWTIATNVD